MRELNCTKWWIFLLGVFCLPLLASAQLIDNDPEMDVREALNFNPDFIAQNKILEIWVKQEVKRNNMPMKAIADFDHYLFDKNGRIEKVEHCERVLKDTLLYIFEYAENGKLLWKETQSKSDTARIVNTYKEEKLVAQEYLMLAGNSQTLLRSETFAYRTAESGTHFQTVSNSYGRPYKQVATKTDSLGFLKTEETTLLVGNKTTKTTFEYNDFGLIDKRTKSKKGEKSEQIFAYDAHLNIEAITFLYNSNPTHEFELAYDPTGLPKFSILRDVDTNKMIISKFSYVFFQD